MRRIATARVRRMTSWSAIATLTIGALAGCSSNAPDPEDAARALARALSAGDVSKIPMVTSATRAQKDRTRIVAALGEAKPSVTVGDVSEEGGRATAMLSTRWTIGTTIWAYETKVRLIRADDRWEVQWAPSVLAPGLRKTERLAVRTTAADRGDILGKGGQALVTERPVVRVGIDKTAIKAGEVAGSAKGLARLLDIDVDTYLKRVDAAGPQAFVEGLILRAGPDRTTRSTRPILRLSPARSSSARICRWRPPARSASRCSAPWARRPRRTSRSPATCSAPVTRWVCPGCRSATTTICAVGRGW